MSCSGENLAGFRENLVSFGENLVTFGENLADFGENLVSCGENLAGFGENLVTLWSYITIIKHFRHHKTTSKYRLNLQVTANNIHTKITLLNNIAVSRLCSRCRTKCCPIYRPARTGNSSEADIHPTSAQRSRLILLPAQSPGLSRDTKNRPYTDFRRDSRP